MSRFAKTLSGASKCDKVTVFISFKFLAKVETRNITLARPEVFAYYGLLSGGVYSPEDIKDPGQVKLIFLSTGEKENPVGIRKATEDLNAAGIKAVGYVSEGTAHEFQTWRRSLKEMAPLLFKK